MKSFDPYTQNLSARLGDCRRCSAPVARAGGMCRHCSDLVNRVIARWRASGDPEYGPELARELGLSREAFLKRVERLKAAA